MQIRDHVEVHPQPSVVRLDQLQAPDASWVTESYYITDEVERHLRSLKALLSQETGSGIFLIGHFGAGKSHFLAYVAQQLEAGHLSQRKPQPVLLSMLNYSASQSLESILDEALELKHTRKDRRQAWKQLMARNPQGLFLIIDELSEFLRSKPSSRDYNEDL